MTRAEELACEIKRGCQQAVNEAEELATAESAFKLQPTHGNKKNLAKQRRRLSFALLALNPPIRAYHELQNPQARLTVPQRIVRWLADLAARGATFRGEP